MTTRQHRKPPRGYVEEGKTFIRTWDDFGRWAFHNKTETVIYIHVNQHGKPVIIRGVNKHKSGLPIGSHMTCNASGNVLGMV